jgi:hypothetical protein
MKLHTETDVHHARDRLREVEERYAALGQDSSEDPHVRELTLWSLKRPMSQLKEQIALFEAYKATFPHG